MSKRFDKNNSVKFQVVHRSQQDSRYYDEDASATVLVPIIDKNKQSKKVRATAAEDLRDVEAQLKENEGKAANFGIAYDDTEYDYLQHLKPIGAGQGIYISKKETIDPKQKNAKLAALLDDTILPGDERTYNYQSQQDVPDEIAGFKPDLNPDLREALVALEDENYLDQDQDVDEVDVFAELLGNEGERKKEISLGEYDRYDDYDYQDGDDDYQDENWDYDNYEEEDYEFEGIEQGAESGNFNWEKDFAKYKNTKGRRVDEFDSDNEYDGSDVDDDGEEDEEDDFVGDLPNIGDKGLKSSNTKSSKKKAKRKKGATTDTSSYSMSSSALCRTEQMTIIDDKFDVLREQYDNLDDEEDEYQPFDLESERDDFMDLVDDFLDNYQLEKRGKRVVKKNDEMERYRVAAMSVTKDNSRVKNRNLANKTLNLSEDLEKLQL